MDDASRKYAGMTLNERLWSAKLIERWDAAVRARDRAAMLDILAQVEIADGPKGRVWIVDTTLADPRKYGY